MSDTDIEKSVNAAPQSEEVDDYTQVRRGTIFEENGLYGIRDIDGSIVVWPKFIFIGRCIDEVLMLEEDGHYFSQAFHQDSRGYLRPKERPYIVNGKAGFKRRDKVIIPPEYDYLMPKFGNNEVFYAVKDGREMYLNDKGEEVLTRVRRFDGEQTDKKSPFHFPSKDFDYVTVMTYIGKRIKSNPNVVKINKVWVELERYSKDEIMRMLTDPSDDLALTEEQLRLLCDLESNRFKFYIAKSHGDHPLTHCMELLNKMKPYIHIGHLIYKIWLPEGAQLSAQELRGFAHDRPGGLAYEPHLRRFAVGHDATLKNGEVRVMLINFDNYQDYCPEDYELEWREKRGSEPVTRLMEEFPHYKKILDDAHSEWMAGIDKKNTVKWYLEYCEKVYVDKLDILKRYCIEDLQYYDGLTWRAAEKALNYFREAGSSVCHALFNFLEQAEAPIRSEKHSNKAVAFFLRAALWALKNGSLVNWYENEHHPMDFLIEIKKKTQNKSVLSHIQKLERKMRSKGAVTTQEREDNADYFKELEYIHSETSQNKPSMPAIDFEKFESLSEEEKQAISAQWTDEEWCEYYINQGAVTIDEFFQELEEEAIKMANEKYGNTHNKTTES